MSEEMGSSGPLRSPGVSGALSICDCLDAALHRDSMSEIDVCTSGQ